MSLANTVLPQPVSPQIKIGTLLLAARTAASRTTALNEARRTPFIPVSCSMLLRSEVISPKPGRRVERRTLASAVHARGVQRTELALHVCKLCAECALCAAHVVANCQQTSQHCTGDDHHVLPLRAALDCASLSVGSPDSRMSRDQKICGRCRATPVAHMLRPADFVTKAAALVISGGLKLGTLLEAYRRNA